MAEWFLEDHERAALAQVSLDAFKADVIAQARAKISFRETPSEDDFQAAARLVFDRTHDVLRAYDTATRDSYVRLVVVYFLRGIDGMNGDDIQQTLLNERIGINTRVKFIYDLNKLMFREGY